MSSNPQYAQIQALVMAACPKYLLDGTTITDPAWYSLGTLYPAIDKALKAGKTVQQIAAAIENIVRQIGWVHATGEYGATNLLDALGLLKKSTKATTLRWLSPAEAKSLASNGANIDNAKRGEAFNGVDGVVVRLDAGATPDRPDANYVAARDLLFKTYTLAPAPAPAPGPTDPTGGQPTGGPGIG